MVGARAWGRVLVAGSLNLDVVVTVDRLPGPGETVPATGRSEGPGGKGLNQAVAAARAGASVLFVGCVGDDENGERLVAALRDEGIDTSSVRRRPGTPSGLALVQVDASGANSIVVDAGANGEVRPIDIDALDVGPADVLVAQGEIPLESTRAFLALGRAARARTVLNLAPFHPPTDGLLGEVSILVVNETEADALGQSLSLRRDGGASALAGRLRELGPDAVILSLGSAGSVAATEARSWSESAARVPVVDTTGAGDALVGVLAAELAAGQPIEAALEVASAAGELAVQRRGASIAMPRRDEIDARWCDGAGRTRVRTCARIWVRSRRTRCR